MVGWLLEDSCKVETLTEKEDYVCAVWNHCDPLTFIVLGSHVWVQKM